MKRNVKQNNRLSELYTSRRQDIIWNKTVMNWSSIITDAVTARLILLQKTETVMCFAKWNIVPADRRAIRWRRSIKESKKRFFGVRCTYGTAWNWRCAVPLDVIGVEGTEITHKRMHLWGDGMSLGLVYKNGEHIFDEVWEKFRFWHIRYLKRREL